MALVVRTEPIGGETIETYEEYLALSKKVGWREFIHSFKAPNVELEKQFSYTYNGKSVRVGDV